MGQHFAGIGQKRQSCAVTRLTPLKSDYNYRRISIDFNEFIRTILIKRELTDSVIPSYFGKHKLFGTLEFRNDFVIKRAKKLISN